MTFWIYVSCYWVLSVCSLWFCVHSHLIDEDDDSGRAWWNKLGSGGQWLVCFVALFLAPLLFPFGLYVFINFMVRRRLYWRRELRTHRDYVCEKIHPANLPVETEEYFDGQTPDIVELGFVDVGNYVVAREPLVMHSRFFLHEDLPMYYSLIHIDDNMTQSAVTLFDDGTVNETCRESEFIDPSQYSASGPFRVQTVAPDETADEFVRLHLEGVLARNELTSAQPLRYREHQIPDILVYEKRVFSKHKKDCGKITSEVPEPVLPQGDVVENVDALVVCCQG